MFNFKTKKSPDPLKENLILYHGNCLDGFGSAFAAWKHFQHTNTTYIPMKYQDHRFDLNICKDKNVYILDYSFSLEDFKKIRKMASFIILLDHHMTAIEELELYDECYFDVNKAGCVLTWEYFHPDIPLPAFFKYIEDGDLNIFKYQNTPLFYKGIKNIQLNFEHWNNLLNESFLEETIQTGKIIQNFYDYHLNEIVQTKSPVMIEGLIGYMINASNLFASDIGLLLISDSIKFVLVWADEGNRVRCSLRCRKGNDVSHIAKKYGGGGHPESCAFYFDTMDEFLIFYNKHIISFTAKELQKKIL